MKKTSSDSVVAAGLACTVSAQALLVSAESRLLAFDRNAVEHFALTRTPGLTDFFALITTFGKASLVAALTLSGAYLLHRYFKKQHLALGLFISVGGATLTQLILKDLIARARPWDLSVLYESTFSFPSGHASVSTALYGFLAYAVWHSSLPHPLRIILAAGLTIFALTIAFSRIYLGVHYPTDVFAGIAVGIMWIILGIHASRIHDAHAKVRAR